MRQHSIHQVHIFTDGSTVYTKYKYLLMREHNLQQVHILTDAALKAKGAGAFMLSCYVYVLHLCCHAMFMFCIYVVMQCLFFAFMLLCYVYYFAFMLLCYVYYFAGKKLIIAYVIIYICPT
jgi:hypothetical protein